MSVEGRFGCKARWRGYGETGGSAEEVDSTICSTLRHRPLASTTAYTDTVYDIALFCFVAKAAGFVWTRGLRGAVDDVELAEL